MNVLFIAIVTVPVGPGVTSKPESKSNNIVLISVYPVAPTPPVVPTVRGIAFPLGPVGPVVPISTAISLIPTITEGISGPGTPVTANPSKFPFPPSATNSI